MGSDIPTKNPSIDHFVLDVGENIDETETACRRLGFNLSSRGRHSVGSENHVAAFRGPYLELLGQGTCGQARHDIAGFPAGLNGIVFASGNPFETYEGLMTLGIRAQKPAQLSRPVGPKETARFGVVRLEPDQADFGRVYFCHHETPELIWNHDSEEHPNGALSIVRAQIATRDPAKATQLLRRIVGEEFLHKDTSGWRLHVGAVDLDFLPPHEAGQWAFANGRTDYVAALTILTSSLNRTAAILQNNGIAGKIEEQRIVIAANNALNLGLEFVEA